MSVKNAMNLERVDVRNAGLLLRGWMEVWNSQLANAFQVLLKKIQSKNVVVM
jgi:hypothetical protein